MAIAALASRSRRSLAAIAGILALVAIGLFLAAGRGTKDPLVLPVGGDPSALAVAGGRVWIAEPGTGKVAVLDAGTGDEAREPLRVGGMPARLALSRSRPWVADAAAGTVYQVGRKPARVGADASDIALAGRALWVASSADGRVYVRDASGTTSLPTGRSPVALATDGRRVVVADAREGTLTPIDARTRRPGTPISVGGAPVDVALDGGTAWVADARGRVLGVDLATRQRTSVPVRRPVAVAAAGQDVYALADRELVRIRDGRVRSRRKVGAAGAALAVDQTHVWVAAGDHLLRFPR